MIRPLLAATIDPMKEPNVFSRIRFPLLVSPKMDGIRALCYNYRVYSRTGLEIPSKQVQELFSQYDGIDGELIVGNPTDVNVYNTTQSSVMSKSKPVANLTLHIIDKIGSPRHFIHRYQELIEDISLITKNVKIIQQTQVNDIDEFIAAEAMFIEAGYEGIMGRRPDGLYKYGRSTMNEQLLMKYKRFTDEEVVVVGFVEQMKNNNEETVNALGYTQRSQHQEGMIPAGTLGKFIVQWMQFHIEISCGAFTHAQRRFIWEHQNMFLGKILVMRYFGVGQEGYMPRFPRAVAWRNNGE